MRYEILDEIPTRDSQPTPVEEEPAQVETPEATKPKEKVSIAKRLEEKRMMEKAKQQAEGLTFSYDMNQFKLECEDDDSLEFLNKLIDMISSCKSEALHITMFEN